MRIGWLVAGALASACGGAQVAPEPAGADHDEGAGMLAQASVTLLSSDRTATNAPANVVRRRGRVGEPSGTVYGGDPYGGFGGDPYGGASYAHWVAPTFNYVNTIRAPHYAVTTTGLDATIEGTVTWPGRVPAATKCGSSIAIGSNHAVAGVIVYIEHVATGRATNGRAQVGGLIAKHGCALAPTAQIAMPLPSSVAIHGDGDRARLRITPPGAAGTSYDLQEGGLVIAEVRPGLTRIESEDGKLAAAWVIGLETPYAAITDDNGRFRIEQLAPGTYDVTIWQAPLATVATDGTFAYGNPIVVHRSVQVAVKQTQKISVALP